MSKTRILAFDPALTCMGWCCFEADPQANGGGRIIDMGTTKTDTDEPLFARATEVAHDVDDLIAEYAPTHIAVEFPVNKRTGSRRFAAQSVMSGPRYGVIVGTVWATCLQYAPDVHCIAIATEDWTKGKPGTANDKNKTMRVKLCENLFGIKIPCCKTDAGNVADAILIAHHAAGLIEYQTKTKGL